MMKSEKNTKNQGRSPPVLRYFQRGLLVLLALLIVIVLAWVFRGGGSISFRPGGQTPTAAGSATD